MIDEVHCKSRGHTLSPLTLISFSTYTFGFPGRFAFGNLLTDTNMAARCDFHWQCMAFLEPTGKYGGLRNMELSPVL